MNLMSVMSFLSPEQQASFMRSIDNPIGALIGSNKPGKSYVVGGPVVSTTTTKLDFGL
jgi:hypothetical protein